MMAVTYSKKRAYIAILILGGVALAIDRFVLPESASAPATVIAEETPRTIAAQKENESRISVPIPELPFPRGLEPFDLGETVRDLFAPPKAFSDADSENGAPDKNGTAASRGLDDERHTSATFMTQHSLEAVLVHERLRIAVIDGVWLRIGDVIDGCTLEGIAGRTARFSCHDGGVVLDMSDRLKLSSD